MLSTNTVRCVPVLPALLSVLSIAIVLASCYDLLPVFWISRFWITVFALVSHLDCIFDHLFACRFWFTASINFYKKILNKHQAWVCYKNQCYKIETESLFLLLYQDIKRSKNTFWNIIPKWYCEGTINETLIYFQIHRKNILFEYP